MKNNNIQFWRIVFTYLIVLYHLNNQYGITTGWYIAVEFFFIVSGYLLASKFERLRENNNKCSAVKYTFDKYKRFMPHHIFSFLVAFCANCYFYKYGIVEAIVDLIKHWQEILLIQTVGITHGASWAYNSPSWYLSALLIVGLILWELLNLNKKVFIRYLAPISVIGVYVYLLIFYGNVSEHREIKYVIWSLALLRGWASMTLGVLSYYISKKIKAKNIILTVISCCCFIFVIVMSAFYDRSYFDFIYAFILASGVAVAFADNNSYKVFNNLIVEKLAPITLAIYLNHKIFRSVIYLMFPSLTWYVYLIFILFVTVYSIITYYLIYRYIPKLFDKKKEKGNV